MRLLQFLNMSESPFYKWIFFFSCLFVLSLLLSYEQTWVHPEVIKTHIPGALRTGTRFVPKDFLTAFDCCYFDGPRSRFLSYLFQISNIKFRIWLFSKIPPHPSFSLTWIFSLILSPVLLFKLTYNLTGSRTTAWVSVSLFLLSTGFLSGVTMLFHPAKPLANFFTIFCLYLASQIVQYGKKRDRFAQKIFPASLLLPLALSSGSGRDEKERFKVARTCLEGVSKIREYVKKRDYFSTKISIWYAVLLGTMLLSFFADETAWLIPICIPVIFPALFQVYRRKTFFIFLYVLPFILFVLFMIFLAPAINQRLGFGGFNFWGYAVRNNTSLKNFKFVNIIFNARNLLFNQIVPWEMVSDSGGYILNASWVPLKQASPPGIISQEGVNPILLYLTFLLSYFGCAFIALPSNLKKIFFHTLAALLLFFIFLTFLLTRHLRVVGCSYYYGNSLSVFLTLSLSLLLSVKKEPWGTLSKFALVSILIISAHNFGKINYNWMHFQDPKYGRAEFFAEETKEMRIQGKLTSAMVLEAWRSRNVADALLAIQKKFPRSSYWLFKELEYVKKTP